MPRSGDRLIKHVVTTCEPGNTGSEQIWNFSNLKLKNASYQLEYTMQGSDSIVAIEHRTMYYHSISGDSLFCLGYENPTTLITYQKPELLLTFPILQNQKSAITSMGKAAIVNICISGNVVKVPSQPTPPVI